MDVDMATTAMNSKQRPAMTVSNTYFDECSIGVKYLLLILFDVPESFSFHFILLVLKVLAMLPLPDLSRIPNRVPKITTSFVIFSSSNAAGRNNQPAARVKDHKYQ